MFGKLRGKACLLAFISSAFLAFGLYHIHALSGVTEGGVLGMTLLLHHWFSVSPALSGFILNTVCYVIGWKTLGKSFIAYSAISTLGFSLAYWLCEQFPPLWPALANMPLAASLLGAVFVGVGAGFSIKAGGAPNGDDALAMSISSITPLKIEQVYLISDLTVLALSLTYIPLTRLVYSLLTVVLSGQIIGLIQRLKLPGIDHT